MRCLVKCNINNYIMQKYVVYHKEQEAQLLLRKSFILHSFNYMEVMYTSCSESGLKVKSC